MSFDVDFSEQNTAFNVSTQEGVNINLEGGSTDDYNSLKNKPKINSVELRGNLTLDELEIQPKGDYVTNNTLDTELEDIVEKFTEGIATKQDELVSGINIKTVNGENILGEGNIEIETSQEETDPTVPAHVKQISENDITNWNNKSEFSGSYNDLTNKPTIPTNNNQLINGAGYQTEDDVIDMINNAFANVSGIEYQVVTSLPAIGKAGTIYLISNSGSKPNIYDEYIYVNNSFEKIGTTEVDLTNYATKEELPTVIPYKASYTDEEKASYGAEIFACFDSSYKMLKPLFVSVSGLLLSYTGRVNDSTLSFGLTITDITNGVHFVDYLMTIDATSQTLQSITAEPTIELVDDEELSTKQDVLVSGTNIKTINSNSILGAGNLNVPTNLENGTSTGSLKNIYAYDDESNGVLGSYAMAEGRYCTAIGKYSHSEGCASKAYGKASHVEGYYTIGNGVTGSHIQGEYNIKDNDGELLHIVGNGSDDDNRSNAHTIDTSGNAWFSGNIYVGSTSGTNKDDGSKKIATEEYVNNAIGGALSGSY